MRYILVVSIACCSLATAIAEENITPEIELLHPGLTNAVAELIDNEKFTEAVKVIEEALARMNLPDKDNARVKCVLLEAVASLHQMTGDPLSETSALLRESEEMCSSNEFSFQERESVFLRGVQLLVSQQDFFRVRTLCDMWLAACERSMNANRTSYEALSIATAALQAGEICLSLGLTDDARRYLGKADELVKGEKLNSSRFLVVYDRNNLQTKIEAMTGDYTTAMRVADLSLEIARKNPSEKEVARALIVYASVCRKGGQYDEALKALMEASELFKFWVNEFGETPSMNDPFTSEELGGLNDVNASIGDTLFLAGQHASAKSFYAKSIEYSRRRIGPNFDVEVEHILGMGRCDMGLDDRDEAFVAFEAARLPFHRRAVRAMNSLASGEQVNEIRKVQQVTQDACELSSMFIDNPEKIAWGCDWVVNFKAIAATAQVRQHRSGFDSEVQDDKQLQLLRRRLSSLALRFTTEPPDAETKATIEQLQQEEAALVRKASFQTGYQNVDESWHSVSEIAKKLNAGEVVVEMFNVSPTNVSVDSSMAASNVGRSRYFAWIISPHSPVQPQLIDLGRASTIDDAISSYHSAVEAAVGSPNEPGLIRTIGEGSAEESIQTSLDHLSQLVLKPILRHLNGATRLILSPDSSLWLVPWAALPVAKNRYAIEDYEISFVVSSRYLLANRAGSDSNTCLIMADPDYDFSDEQTVHDGLRSLQAIKPFSGIAKVPRLPHTRSEANAIKPRLASYVKNDPIVYTDERAVETVFKATKRPKVIVLSTHGYFLPDQVVRQDGDSSLVGKNSIGAALLTDGKPYENPLLRCGLLLAGCNRTRTSADDNTEDGILTGLEIVSVDLRGTELVVLSACETGLGSIQNGEGVVGLRHAFQLAGAESVVATLWKVADQESAKLMNEFFTNLAGGQRKSEALRNAQLSTIETRRRRYGAAHPFFWAAHTLTGSQR